MQRWLSGSLLLVASFALTASGQTCTYRFDPQSTIIPAGGGSGSFAVTTAGNQVCPYAGAGSPSTWLTPSPNNVNTGTTSGYYLFFYTAAPNNSADARTGALTVGGSAGANWTNYAVQFLQRGTSPAQVFDDVPLSNPFADYVNLMRTYGITDGCATNPLRYCPTDLVNRAQMAVFITRSVLNTDNFTFPATPYFADVPSSHPQFKYIQKLRELGITLGCGDGTNYCPAENVSRGQMALFLMRAKFGSAAVPANLRNSTTAYFTDVPTSDAAYSSIQKLRDYAITSGCTTTTFCPTRNVTREEMAVLLIRALETPTFELP
jgi:hypothetical protein